MDHWQFSPLLTKHSRPCPPKSSLLPCWTSGSCRRSSRIMWLTTSRPYRPSSRQAFAGAVSRLPVAELWVGINDERFHDKMSSRTSIDAKFILEIKSFMINYLVVQALMQKIILLSSSASINNYYWCKYYLGKIKFHYFLELDHDE